MTCSCSDGSERPACFTAKVRGKNDRTRDNLAELGIDIYCMGGSKRAPEAVVTLEEAAMLVERGFEVLLLSRCKRSSEIEIGDPTEWLELLPPCDFDARKEKE